MLVIGLTGGIASGKSTVARLFAERGVPVIDADRIARGLVEPGQPALARIAETFGPSVLDAHGRLDRGRLRALAFSDSERLKALEAILHPPIRREMRSRLQKHHAPYCVLVIPLLVESGWQDLVDRILVVDAPEALQRQRVRERDRLPEWEIDAILNAQASRAERLAVADDVLANDQGLGELERAVDALHHRYLAMAQDRSSNEST